MSIQEPESKNQQMGVRRSLCYVAILCAFGGISVCAQNQVDASGNGFLKGPYFVRQVLLANINQTTSAVGRAVSLTGTMTFDGNGNYTFTGQKTDTQSGGTAQNYSTSGMYKVSSNAMVQIQNPIDSTDTEFGGLGAIGPSAIVASATEGSYNDIFVAIPAGSGISNSGVQGTYQMGFIDFLQGNASQVRDGYFTVTSNGSGSFGNVAVNGAMANQSSNNTTQNLSGVTFSISNSNGSGTLTFPTASSTQTALVSGQKTFYVSADGNILLAGNPGGFDIMVGMKAISGASNSQFQGTYFITAIENDASGLSSGNNFIDSYYGSTLALGAAGSTILHLRLAPFNSSAYDYTYDNRYNFAPDGTDQHDYFGNASNSAPEKILTVNGQGTLFVGRGNLYGLVVGVLGKLSTPTQVFLDPQKIWNAASFAPITNSVAPGEYVSLFGSGMSPAGTTLQAQSLPLPTNLGGVQVTVNGRPAPITYVSPSQINILIPYANQEPYTYIQVNNNGTMSNQVMTYTSATSPGVFAINQPGFGPAAVTHADNSLVTQNNPAKAGETLVLYVTGLGAVTPAVSDGAPAPSDTLSKVNDQNLIVEIQDQQFNFHGATISFAGLTPGFAGLYQINFVMPTGVASGLGWVNVGTTDGYTSEAKIYAQ